MWTATLLLSLLFAAQPPLPGSSPAPADPPSVELPAELARVLTDYETAWRGRDAAALSRLFAEDGYVLQDGRPPSRGRAAIERAYAGAGGPLSLRAFALATEGSVGYILGGYAREPGTPDLGKFTLTLRKEGGRWLIVSDMDNPNQRSRPPASPAPAAPVAPALEKPAPIVLGETFTLDSQSLGETRRINVYRPPGTAPDALLPVLYMPDGGMAEDFVHVAGLVQVSVGNGTMRPFLLVGIENTERRRDLAGPTEDPEDRKIAPNAGGAARFRQFLRTELKPAVAGRYLVTPESAIVGESLAGLFIVETFLLEPDLFDIYMAFDPSLWWNRRKLVGDAAGHLKALGGAKKTLYLASSDQRDIADATALLAKTLQATPRPGLAWHYEPMPRETHGTIYHPAALKAFRAVLAPAEGGR